VGPFYLKKEEAKTQDYSLHFRGGAPRKEGDPKSLDVATSDIDFA